MALELDTTYIPKFRHYCNWGEAPSTDYSLYSSKDFYWEPTMYQWPILSPENMALRHTSVFAVLLWWLSNHTEATERTVQLETGMGRRRNLTKGLTCMGWEKGSDIRTEVWSFMYLFAGWKKQNQGQEQPCKSGNMKEGQCFPMQESPVGVPNEMRLRM